MKLSLLFAFFLSAQATGFSPILFHYLCSNGYMSPSVDIKALLYSHSSHDFSKELVEIVTDAQEQTGLIIPLHSNKTPSRSQFRVDYLEHVCYRNVLEKANILHFHQVWSQHKYNDVESNIDSYFLRLYWTNNDLRFLSAIKSSKNKALALVLHSFKDKVLSLFEEYRRLYTQSPSYSKYIMDAYKARGLLAPSLPPLDFQWIKDNYSVEPKVHYSLLSELLRRKTISSKFFISSKKSYSVFYKDFIRTKGSKDVSYGFNRDLAPPAIMKFLELYCVISNGWLAFWIEGMRIKRAMPSPFETALGPILIESFNMEIRFMTESMKENDQTRKYASLNCSCLHMNYLLGCIRFSLLFTILKHQDHATCIDLISTHRKLALEMIDNLANQ